MQLAKSFTLDQYAGALESWEWIGVDGKEPVLSSLFGDVFLRDTDGCWYLDALGGSLRLLWPDLATLRTALESPEGQDEYLLGGLASAAAQQGLVLTESQVFVFTPPPVLGGPFDVANLSAMDFVVAVNIAGQLHEQVRDLPPGTRITGVTVGPSSEPKRSRWRRRR